MNGTFTLASFAHGDRGGSKLGLFLSNVARLLCQNGKLDITEKEVYIEDLHFPKLLRLCVNVVKEEFCVCPVQQFLMGFSPK